MCVVTETWRFIRDHVFVEGLFAFAIALAAFLLIPSANRIDNALPAIILGLVGVIGIVFFRALIVVPVLLDNQRFIDIEAVQNDRDKLAAQAVPRLEIQYWPGIGFPFIDDWLKDKETPELGMCRGYRVRVHNLSKIVTIRTVRVWLQDIQPSNGIRLIPCRLHQMHDNPILVTEFALEFDLHADGYQDVDVVWKETSLNWREIHVWSVPYGLPNRLPQLDYNFTIVAEGEDVVPCNKQFKVSVDTEGLLHFDELGIG